MMSCDVSVFDNFALPSHDIFLIKSHQKCFSLIAAILALIVFFLLFVLGWVKIIKDFLKNVLNCHGYFNNICDCNNELFYLKLIIL